TDGDAKIMRGVVSLLLSPDGQVLSWIQHRPVRRWALYSSLDPDRWLVTTNLSGELDLIGWNEEEMLPRVSFPVLLRHHLERISASGAAVWPFTPQTAVAEHVAREQRRAHAIVQSGLGRYRSAN